MLIGATRAGVMIKGGKLSDHAFRSERHSQIPFKFT